MIDLSQVSWGLVSLVLLIGVMVSFIGDWVGRRLGKRRVSLFGLRPRHTGVALAVLSGVVVSLLTLAVLSFASEGVRMALLGMKAIQERIEGLKLELAENERVLAEVKAEKERLEGQVKELKDLASRLREGVAVLREGEIAVRANELLAQEVIPPGLSEEEVKSHLERLLQRASVVAVLRGARPSSDDGAVFVPASNFKGVAEKLTSADVAHVVRAMAYSNSVVGEPVSALLVAFPNRLVFKRGDVIASGTVDGSASPEEIEAALHLLLQRANVRAIEEGVYPDPITRRVGAIPASELYEAVGQLRSKGRPSAVRVVADRDVYSSGPVSVRLEVE